MHWFWPNTGGRPKTIYIDVNPKLKIDEHIDNNRIDGVKRDKFASHDNYENGNTNQISNLGSSRFTKTNDSTDFNALVNNGSNDKNKCFEFGENEFRSDLKMSSLSNNTFTYISSNSRNFGRNSIQRDYR